jgi:hypothetical protein
MTRDEAISMLQGPYGREIGNVASSYTAVFFWMTIAPTAEIGHGSIFFLECGSGAFAVTANHVYEAYLERKQLDPSLTCQIGNLPFVPEARLIDRDPELDVATFRIEEREVEADGKVIHRVSPNNWPPKPPDLGKGVFFAGYPKVHRKVHHPKKVEWGTYVGVLTATSIGERHIVCQYERDEMVDMFGTGTPPVGQWLGGLSGAPLWTLVETGVFSWRLGGILYQFSTEFEVLYARRPDCILADGRLCR